MKLPTKLKDNTRVIGYFAYTNSGDVFCDGDACIIADTEDKLKDYIIKANFSDGKSDILRKTRFGEIVEGMRKGGAYAFDEGVYKKFVEYAKNNDIDNLPSESEFPEPQDGMAFIKIQAK